MSVLSTHHRIRLQLDASSFEAPRDVLRAAIPAIWSGRDLAIELGLFDHGEPVDTSNLADLTFSLKRLPEDGEAPAWDAPLYLQQTQPIIDHTVTTEEWEAGTDAHATLYFSAEATRIAPGAYWLAVVVRTQGSPARELTFGAGPCDVYSDGFARGNVVPIIEGQAYSVSAADARFVSYTAGDARYLTPAAGDARYLGLAVAEADYLTRTAGDGRYLDLGTAATLASQSWSDGRFLAKTANLADLPDVAAARVSLEVPSRDEWLTRALTGSAGGLFVPPEQRIEGPSQTFRWGLGGGLLRLCLALESWQPATPELLWASHTTGLHRWHWEILAGGDWRFTWIDALGTSHTRTLANPGLRARRPYDLVLQLFPGSRLEIFIDGRLHAALDLASVPVIDLGQGNAAPTELLGGSGLAGVLCDQIVVMNTPLDALALAELAAQPARWNLQPLSAPGDLLTNGAFTAGASSWTPVADMPNTINFLADEGYAGSPVVRVERPSPGALRLRLEQNVGLLAWIGKALRLHLRYRSTGPDPVNLRVRGIGGSFPNIYTINLPESPDWTALTLDFVVPDVPSHQIGLMFDTNTRVYAAWFDDLSLVAAGVVARVECMRGTGARLSNAAGLGTDWALRGGEPAHLRPVTRGATWAEGTSWKAAELGTTGGVTWLSRLAAGAVVGEIWAEVTKAGLAGDTVSIGTAATPARFATLPLGATGWQRLTPADAWPLATSEDVWLTLNRPSTAEFRLQLVLR